MDVHSGCGGVSMPDKKLFKSVKTFENRINAYFTECRANGNYPDEAGMILYLGLEREAYDRYLCGGEGKGYAAALKRAQLKRESIIIRDIYGSEKASTGKIFLARQISSGGLPVKPAEKSKKVTVDVRINGESAGGQFD